MGNIIDQVEGTDPWAGAPAPVRCPLCAHMNTLANFCRHVRWTFDQGDPIDFARFAVETSNYVHARGGSTRDIPRLWWTEYGDWVVERVLLRFDATDGFVFGDLAEVDLLARDIWLQFHPDPVKPEMTRW